MKAIHKFNGGSGATLCNNCHSVINTGLTADLFCKKCTQNMTKKELLDAMYLTARKDANKVSIACLGTMKGEVENQLKVKKADVNTLIEDYAIKSKKVLLQFKPDNWEQEIELLANFLPAELTEEDIKNYVQNVVQNNPDMHVGKLTGMCMSGLKGNDQNIIKKYITEFTT